MRGASRTAFRMPPLSAEDASMAEMSRRPLIGGVAGTAGAALSGSVLPPNLRPAIAGPGSAPGPHLPAASSGFAVSKLDAVAKWELVRRECCHRLSPGERRARRPPAASGAARRDAAGGRGRAADRRRVPGRAGSCLRGPPAPSWPATLRPHLGAAAAGPLPGRASRMELAGPAAWRRGDHQPPGCLRRARQERIPRRQTPPAGRLGSSRPRGDGAPESRWEMR